MRSFSERNNDIDCALRIHIGVVFFVGATRMAFESQRNQLLCANLDNGSAQCHPFSRRIWHCAYISKKGDITDSLSRLLSLLIYAYSIYWYRFYLFFSMVYWQRFGEWTHLACERVVIEHAARVPFTNKAIRNCVVHLMWAFDSMSMCDKNIRICKGIVGAVICDRSNERDVAVALNGRRR